MTDAKHEAPAEGAGERIDWQQQDAVAGALHAVLPLDVDWQHMRVAGKAFVDTLMALRARSSAPEAREAVAWRVRTSCGEGGFLADTYPHNGQQLIKGGYSVQPLFTHPAAPSADKLRIAVEALTEIADTDPDDGTSWFHERADQALAALKAEGAG